jgi:hypothetical protein
VGSYSILFGSLRGLLSTKTKRCHQRALARLPCWRRFAELNSPNDKTDHAGAQYADERERQMDTIEDIAVLGALLVSSSLSVALIVLMY